VNREVYRRAAGREALARDLVPLEGWGDVPLEPRGRRSPLAARTGLLLLLALALLLLLLLR
jgi:hypothetical protein